LTINAEALPGSGPELPGDLDMSMRADLAHLPVIRSVAANIAMREDYTVESIADWRLAVDEAVSELIVRARPETTLRCRFRVDSAGIQFIAVVDAAKAEVPPATGFGWRVLTTLTDSASAELHGDSGSPRLRIELFKRRRVDGL
jgi:serine/threonine-protein kinase RsbW